MASFSTFESLPLIFLQVEVEDMEMGCSSSNLTVTNEYNIGRVFTGEEIGDRGGREGDEDALLQSDRSLQNLHFP